MSSNNVESKNLDELYQQLYDLLREQFNLRMQKGMSEMPRPHLFKKVRRNIARIKTLINNWREGK